MMTRITDRGWRIVWALAALMPAAGCGDIQMELAAAEAMPQLADQIELALDEYHQLGEARYADREAAVLAAFIERVTRDRQAPPATLEQHAAEAAAAMARIRADREIGMQRRRAAQENVQTLRDMATTIRGVAIDSMSLRDEARRYIHGWIDVLERERRQRRKEKADAADRPGRMDWAAAARAGVDRALMAPTTRPGG